MRLDATAGGTSSLEVTYRSTMDRRCIYTNIVVSQARNTPVRSAYGRLDGAYNSGIRPLQSVPHASRPLIAALSLESQDIIPESFDLCHGSHGVILETRSHWTMDGCLAPPLPLLPQRLYLPWNVMNRQVSILMRSAS